MKDIRKHSKDKSVTSENSQDKKLATETSVTKFVIISLYTHVHDFEGPNLGIEVKYKPENSHHHALY